MGKNASVLMVTDDQIRDFAKQPGRLRSFLTLAVPMDRAAHYDLFDWWAVVHYAITDGAADAQLPLAAIRKGDVQYIKDPAHAIYSATARALADKLQEITPELARQTLSRRDVNATVYPGRYWRLANLPDDAELHGRLRGFRMFVNDAVSENRGLLFSRYEDW